MSLWLLRAMVSFMLLDSLNPIREKENLVLMTRILRMKTKNQKNKKLLLLKLLRLLLPSKIKLLPKLSLQFKRPSPLSRRPYLPFKKLSQLPPRVLPRRLLSLRKMRMRNLMMTLMRTSKTKIYKMMRIFKTMMRKKKVMTMMNRS